MLGNYRWSIYSDRFTMAKVPRGPLFGAPSTELRRLCGAAGLQRERNNERLVIQSWMDFNEDPMIDWNPITSWWFRLCLKIQWDFNGLLDTHGEFIGSSWEQGLGWWISSANLGIWSYLINEKSGLNHQERESTQKAQINVTKKNEILMFKLIFGWIFVS